jgi:hypothetical protein
MKRARSLDELTTILEQHREELHTLQGVTGVGVGLGPGIDEPVIQVFVTDESDLDEVGASVERLLGDAPVAVIVSGEMRPLG